MVGNDIEYLTTVDYVKDKDLVNNDFIKSDKNNISSSGSQSGKR